MTTETTDRVSEASARIGEIMKHRARLNASRDRVHAAKAKLDEALAEWKALDVELQAFFKALEEERGIFNRKQRRATGNRRRVA